MDEFCSAVVPFFQFLSDSHPIRFYEIFLSFHFFLITKKSAFPNLVKVKVQAEVVHGSRGSLGCDPDFGFTVGQLKLSRIKRMGWALVSFSSASTSPSEACSLYHLLHYQGGAYVVESVSVFVNFGLYSGDAYAIK